MRQRDQGRLRDWKGPENGLGVIYTTRVRVTVTACGQLETIELPTLKESATMVSHNGSEFTRIDARTGRRQTIAVGCVAQAERLIGPGPESQPMSRFTQGNLPA